MLICKLLLNENPSSYITYNIQTIYAALARSEVNYLTLLDYVRNCRVVVQNLNGMLAACRLEQVDSWHHIFTDGTTRRQIIFQNLVIGLMTDGDFESIIASSCIFLENGTSEKQVEAVKNKLRC